MKAQRYREERTRTGFVLTLKSSGADSSVLTAGVPQGGGNSGGFGLSERHVVVLAE
jgi:hypothetical protein